MKRFVARLLLLSILVTFFICGNVNAASLSFMWDPPITGSPIVTGYKFYYGTASRTYTTNIDVGNVTKYTLANLDVGPGGTWFFAVTAYATSGDIKNESTYSNEVSVTFPVVPSNFKIVITVSP